MGDPRSVSRPAGSGWAPAWVLVISLAFLALVAVAFHMAVDRSDQARFRNAVQSASDRIRARLDTYTQALVATRNHLALTPQHTEQAFREYASGLNVTSRYPGIQGVGLSLRLTPAGRRDLERRRRTAGQRDFRVWPDSARTEYHAIVDLEPLDRRNAAAIGYDMFTEPIRREAMMRAGQTGAPSASRRVTLVQEIDPAKQAGFLIYVPVYEGGLTVPLSERERRLRGFVYSPFRAGDLLAGIFGTEDEPRVGFEVYDGPALDPRQRMAAVGEIPDGYRPRHRQVETVTVAGTQWTIGYYSTPAFDQVSGRRLLPMLLVIGLTAAAALTLVSRSQARALHLAEVAERDARMARAEAEALAADLQQAVRIRDDFLAVAGHELRTPLAAVKLQLHGLELLWRRGVETLAPVLPSRLQKASANLDRLDRLINELLDVSRISSGRVTLQFEEVDAGQLAAEVFERFAEQLARAGCSLAAQLEPGVVGRWDRNRLDQVITNLAANALKYGAGRPVEVVVERQDAEARIAVTDRGIGIAPEDADRIFRRFERATSDRHYGGLGLGLWIAREIVEAHGGSIEVASTLGEGSTFTVRLPLRPPEAG